MLRTDLQLSMFPQAGNKPVRWRIADELVPYELAVETMEREVALIADGGDELVWLVEHPPLYTAGTSADAKDLVQPDRFRSSPPAAAVNTPITVPASALPM